MEGEYEKGKISVLISIIMLFSFMLIGCGNIVNNILENRGVNDFEVPEGVSATLIPSDKKKLSKEEFEEVTNILSERLDSQHLFEHEIVIDEVKNEVSIKVAMEKVETDFDYVKFVAELIEIGNLTFTEYEDDEKKGKNLVESENIVLAIAEEEQQSGGWVVKIKFNDKGRTEFTKLTEKNIGRQLAIFMDEELITAPIVVDKIDSDEVLITGIENKDTATRLAILINSGRLPCSLEISSVNFVAR